MVKPTIYIETTVVAQLTSRLPKDPHAAVQMVATRTWWDGSRADFDS